MQKTRPVDPSLQESLQALFHTIDNYIHLSNGVCDEMKSMEPDVQALILLTNGATEKAFVRSYMHYGLVIDIDEELPDGELKNIGSKLIPWHAIANVVTPKV